MHYNGERFLDILFKDLYKSEEVLHTKEKGDTKEVSIARYLERLERVHRRVNSRNKKDILKQLYYDRYVIKIENLPYHLSERDKDLIIESQKKSLSIWIDYLTDEHTSYPMWARYWVFQQMLKMGTYDEIKGKYTKRDKTTTNPFVEVNPEIIAICIGNVMRLLGDKKLPVPEIRKIASNVSFEKMYIEYHQSKKTLHKSFEGQWVKYDQGDRDAATRLSESLRGYHTDWCTADESWAIRQVCGHYSDAPQGGDFYVYYTLDENGEAKIPRIAIRLIGHDRIGEIRGIEDHQNLEEEMIPVLEKKLKEMSFLSHKDVLNNLKIIDGLKYLVSIRKKTTQHIQLTPDEIYDLYTKKFGFGWEQDPLVGKMLKIRDNCADYQFIKERELPDRKNFVLTNENYFISIGKKFLDDLDVVLELVPEKIEVLKLVTDDVLSDKEKVLQIVLKNGLAIQYISPDMEGYSSIAMAAVTKNGEAIKYIDWKTDNYYQLCLAAVKQNGLAYQFVHEIVRNSDKIESVALEAVKQNGFAIKYVPKTTDHYSDICMDAVKQRGKALQFVPRDVENYNEIALEAVKRDYSVLQFITPDLANYSEIALEAFKQEGSGYLLSYVPITTDRYSDIALEAVKQDGISLKYVPTDIENYFTIALEAVKQNGLAIGFVPPNIENYSTLALAAVKQNGCSIKDIPPDYVIDYNYLALEAVKNNYVALRYLALDYITDYTLLAKQAIKNDVDNEAIQYVPLDVDDYYDIMLDAILRSSGEAMFFVEDFTAIKNYKSLFDIGILLFEKKLLGIFENDTISDVEKRAWFDMIVDFDNINCIPTFEKDPECVARIKKLFRKIIESHNKYR